MMDRVIKIEGVIGVGDCTAEAIWNQLKANPPGSPIIVDLNSQGGLAEPGLRIYGMLRDRSRKITVYVGATAAGSASLIAMAGSEIVMKQKSILMISKPEQTVAGNVDDLEKATKHLKGLTNWTAQIYADRTGKPKSEILSMMAATTWMDADAALKEGFCTRIEGRSRNYLFDPAGDL